MVEIGLEFLQIVKILVIGLLIISGIAIILPLLLMFVDEIRQK